MATSEANLVKRGKEVERWVLRNNLSLGRISPLEFLPEEYAELVRVAQGGYNPPILTPYEFVRLVRGIRRKVSSRKNHKIGKYLLQFLDSDGEVMRLKSVGWDSAVIPELGIKVVQGDVTRRGRAGGTTHIWRERWVGEVTDENLMLLYMSLSTDEINHIPKYS